MSSDVFLKKNITHTKMIKFVLMVNKQGQTRLAQYHEFMTIEERVALEAEIIRKCLGRNENQVSWVLIWFIFSFCNNGSL